MLLRSCWQVAANKKLTLKLLECSTASLHGPRGQARPPPTERLETKRAIYTVPNIITASRIAVTPVMGYFIVNGMPNYAMACIAYGAATDLLDGFLARILKQNTNLGAIMDPIADKVMLMTCFICVGYAGLLPIWLCKGFVYRDLLLLGCGSAIRYYGFAEKLSWSKFFDFQKHPTIGFEPTFVSKVNTALQCSLLLVVLSTQHLKGDPTYDWLLFALECLTMTTTAVSAAQYFARTQVNPTFAMFGKKS